MNKRDLAENSISQSLSYEMYVEQFGGYTD